MSCFSLLMFGVMNFGQRQLLSFSLLKTLKMYLHTQNQNKNVTENVFWLLKKDLNARFDLVLILKQIRF